MTFASPPSASEKELWSLQPLARPAVPQAAGGSAHPIDAFVEAACREQGVTPLGRADKLVWLRRVTLDLTGLLPTVEEQEAFLRDPSEGAAEKAVDRLLASEQYGVRYGRHWLDALRFADLDENMPAAAGLHLWRDWVVGALNQDLPYDQFVRAQISGNRAAKRRGVSAAGHLMQVEPRPEDLFALGFLARGATSASDADQELAMSAVETISSAFLGMTMGCAKCHDHSYDPIKQTDFYSMKALFDPLVLRKVELATPEQVFARGRAVEEYESRLKVLVDEMRGYIRPFYNRLYEERLSMLPKEAQAAIRKPEEDRTVEEQKIADDYHPILRIDPPKIKEIMPRDQVTRYEAYLKEINDLKAPEPLPQFWTVADDAKRASETNYVLTTGDPSRPKRNQPVTPGFPWARRKPEFREGRRETFVDWLTSPEHPLFARVAVNRMWQWHFGNGLHLAANDFGVLGGKPRNQALLDWLASEFVAQGFRMKPLHRLIVTSEAYRRASAGSAHLESANGKADPENQLLWKFPLRRLEAEPIRDALLQLAGVLDTTVGGKSFDAGAPDKESKRRTMYMSRGYRSFAEVMPDFLRTFDAEDGRSVCAKRTETVTAPQALFMMNHEQMEEAAKGLSDRLRESSGGDLLAAVTTGYRLVLGRAPSDAERAHSLGYLEGNPARLKGFAWLLLNLDEFLYVR